jgi:hypothetical protein
MPNYAETKLYELIEHDESGQPVVYRGHTTQQLHQRLANHRRDFKLWKEGNNHYVSSFEVLKHGPARIELVRVVCCFNKKEANREEGKFIRELPTCVNIYKNYENHKEYREANKGKIKERGAKYYEANIDMILEKKKEYREANKKAILEKQKAYVEANKKAILEKQKAYVEANKKAILEKQKAYREANKGAQREYQKAYRDWKRIENFIFS